MLGYKSPTLSQFHFLEAETAEEAPRRWLGSICEGPQGVEWSKEAQLSMKILLSLESNVSLFVHARRW